MQGKVVLYVRCNRLIKQMTQCIQSCATAQTDVALLSAEFIPEQSIWDLWWTTDAETDSESWLEQPAILTDTVCEFSRSLQQMPV
jgi:siroheme synthase